MFYASNQVFLFFAIMLLTNKSGWSIIIKVVRKDLCGCSSMVEFQPSKLAAWVRFPSPAPGYICALSSVDRVPGYEPVGRRFESFRARQNTASPIGDAVFCVFLARCLLWVPREVTLPSCRRAARLASLGRDKERLHSLLLFFHHKCASIMYHRKFVVPTAVERRITSCGCFAFSVLRSCC